MWSIGCIMAELYLGKPLFPGKNRDDQLVRIFSTLGIPNISNWPEMAAEFPEFSPLSYKISPNPSDLRRALGGDGERLCLDGFDLMMRMLQYSPKNRITALEALSHRYFNDMLINNLGKKASKIAI